jgi:hypothetical protein
MERKSLSDILRGDQADALAAAWDSTEAAADHKPLPKGEFVARVERGELASAKSGTPGYKLCFQVIEGEHAGRRAWHDCWLTPAAMPMTKRDLAKLGIVEHKQLAQPLPQGIVCRLRVTLRRNDDGAEYNRVESFDVLRVETPASDPFAPPAELPAETPVETPDSAQGDAQEGAA